MDVLFLEHLEFKLPVNTFAVCQVAPSKEEMLRRAMVEVGLELIDYGSFIARDVPVPQVLQYAPETIFQVKVEAFSKAYRERAERAAAHR